MKPIKNILVGLDLTDLNKTIIKFAAFLSRAPEVEAIYFGNVILHLEIPKEVLKEFPDLIDHAIRERKQLLEKVIKKNLKIRDDIKTQIIVKSGDRFRAFASMANEHDIDLILIGRKENVAGSGILAQRLARRAGIHLVLIPEGSQKHLDDGPKKILVPADFSKHSSLALEHAIKLASHSKAKVKIYCLNVIHVPTGYHYSGKSYEEFGEILKRHAENHYKQFIKDIDTKGINITPSYTLAKHDDLVKCIYNYALKIKANGIIFGAKGITATSAFFIGSIAEKMIKLDSEFPLMVVRRKGEKVNLLHFIGKI